MAAWLWLGAVLGLTGCAEIAEQPVAKTEQAGSDAALRRGQVYKFGYKLAGWFQNRPSDPKAAVAAWGQACSDAGGRFIPNARGAPELRDVGLMVPGKGWCRLVVEDLDLSLTGGWVDAASLAKPENRTVAAAMHWFFIFYESIALPPEQTVGNVMEGADAFQTEMIREMGKERVRRAERRADPDDARCALFEVDAVEPLPELEAAWGQWRWKMQGRACVVGPRQLAVVIVEEAAWSGDPGAAVRGAALRQQIGRILASLPVGR